MEEGNYLNDARDGVWHMTNVTGKNTDITMEYRDGLADGKMVSYLRLPIDNTAMASLSADDRLLLTKDNMLIITIISYFKFGLQEGPRDSYDRDGRKLASGHFHNDNKDGLWTYFNADGSIAFTNTYDNNRLIHSTADSNFQRNQLRWLLA